MIRLIAIIVLVGANVIIWTLPVPHGLAVSFLNIGQGDAILIQGPTGVDVLVDGGPDSSVLREVGNVLPFFDRSIDAVVATHPDADHISGLPYILNRYEVKTILEPGVLGTTRAWATFVDATNSEIKNGAAHILARRGTRLILGGGAYADVLYPTSDVDQIKETNAGSVVLHVVYGATSFMLTGDLPAKQELYISSIYGTGLQSDVLKAGHHGSKNSSTPEFLAAVAPKYGVFSRGCDNKYGHPAEETVALFQSISIPTFDTCTEGAITFISDGQVLTHSP